MWFQQKYLLVSILTAFTVLMVFEFNNCAERKSDQIAPTAGKTGASSRDAKRPKIDPLAEDVGITNESIEDPNSPPVDGNSTSENPFVKPVVIVKNNKKAQQDTLSTTGFGIFDDAVDPQSILDSGLNIDITGPTGSLFKKTIPGVSLSSNRARSTFTFMEGSPAKKLKIKLSLSKKGTKFAFSLSKKGETLPDSFATTTLSLEIGGYRFISSLGCTTKTSKITCQVAGDPEPIDENID